MRGIGFAQAIRRAVLKSEEGSLWGGGGQMARMSNCVELIRSVRLRVNGQGRTVPLKRGIGQVNLGGNQDSHNRAQQHKQQECRERRGFE